MRVIIANSAGFCMGVRQAMNKAFVTLKKEKAPIYTYGPLIHNPQVVRLLTERGVQSVSDMPKDAEGTIIIRAHGISPQEREKIKATHLSIVDATCPKVMKIHSAAKKHHKQGYLVVVVGDRDHPEVSGILGYTEGKGVVVGSPDEVKGLPDAQRVLVVAQTTFSQDMFAAILEEMRKRYPNAELEAVDTLCDSTKRRQDEVKELARQVDAMVIVGGKNSGNTKRLFEEAKRGGVPAFHVEDETELDPKDFADFKTVGLTAGASTPNWVIMRVCEYLADIDKNRRSQVIKKITDLFRFIVLGYFWAGLAAGGLATAASLLLGVESFLLIPVVSGLYVYAMHVINRTADSEGMRFNDPARVQLYGTGRPWFMAAGGIASLLSVILAWRLSPAVAALIVLLILAGVAFTVVIVPRRLAAYTRWRRLKDIPASKTFFVAAGWSAVSTGVPYLSTSSHVPALTLVAVFLFCFLLVFIRASLYDIRDIQGDAVVGRETIPIIIGKRWTQRVVLILVLISAALLVVGSAVSILPSLGWWLLVIPVYALGSLGLYRSRFIFQGVPFEVVVDFEFVLAGLIAVGWYLTVL